MISREIGAEIQSVASVRAQQQSGNGTVNGVGIDRMPTGSSQGHMSCELHAQSGPIYTGAGPLLDIKMQDSADNSTFADLLDRAGNVVAAAQITALNTERRVSVDLGIARQFVRAVAVVSGTTTLVDMAATIVLGGTINPPVA